MLIVTQPARASTTAHSHSQPVILDEFMSRVLDADGPAKSYRTIACTLSCTTRFSRSITLQFTPDCSHHRSAGRRALRHVSRGVASTPPIGHVAFPAVQIRRALVAELLEEPQELALHAAWPRRRPAPCSGPRLSYLRLNRRYALIVAIEPDRAPVDEFRAGDRGSIPGDIAEEKVRVIIRDRITHVQSSLRRGALRMAR